MDHLTPILRSKQFVLHLKDISLVVDLDLSILFSESQQPLTKAVISADDLLPVFASIFSTIYGTVSALVTFTESNDQQASTEELAAETSFNSQPLSLSSSQISHKASPLDNETTPTSISFASTIDQEDNTPLQIRSNDASTDAPDFLSLAHHFLKTYPLTLSDEGIGGTYFLEDENGDKFAVFKPVDEEPGAPNHPKTPVTAPLLPPGGGAFREAAAFLLDRGFAGVPPTHLLENVQTANNGIKSGSLQKFVKNDGESSSVGSSSFLVDDVHRIGILDIRIFNLDRNGENILIKKEGNQYRLIPIDHSFCLPESLDGAFFDWMFWRQSKQPFCDETIRHVTAIDINEDAKILRELGISEGSIRTMVVSTMLLKHCVKLGKNLFEIASLVCRDYTGAPSQLEQLVSAAEDSLDFYLSFESLLQTQIVELV